VVAPNPEGKFFEILEDDHHPILADLPFVEPRFGRSN
jgi:hypothetical protein